MPPDTMFAAATPFRHDCCLALPRLLSRWLLYLRYAPCFSFAALRFSCCAPLFFARYFDAAAIDAYVAAHNASMA